MKLPQLNMRDLIRKKNAGGQVREKFTCFQDVAPHFCFKKDFNFSHFRYFIPNMFFDVPVPWL